MKEYRQNAHVASLVVWAGLCICVAVFLFWHSRRIVDRPLEVAEIAGGVALLVFGPAALAAYLIRADTLWVAVDRERGLLVRGKRAIPWEAIERIDRRRPRLRKSSGPVEVRSVDWKKGDLGLGCIDVAGWGCFGGGEGVLLVLAIGFLLLAFFLFWLIFFVFLPLLVVPVLEVFAPLGDRIRIVTREGRPLLLRDLRDADGFLAAVRPHVEVRER